MSTFSVFLIRSLMVLLVGGTLVTTPAAVQARSVEHSDPRGDVFDIAVANDEDIPEGPTPPQASGENHINQATPQGESDTHQSYVRRLAACQGPQRTH